VGPADKLQLRYNVGQLFTPATPINEKELFAGRLKQVHRVIDAVSQRGQHAIVFGERGVGKTSLANVMAGFLQGVAQTIIAPRVACDTSDTFQTLWRRVFEKIEFDAEVTSMGLKPEVTTETVSLAESLPEQITPDLVRAVLAEIAHRGVVILIIDEFDRLKGTDDTRLFADTIKTLSDYAVQATVVLVGVADAVEDLIEGHESVLRNLVQIPVPRMSEEELRRIITDRLPKLGMTIAEDALAKICALSRGLPHYAHLIGQHAAWRAIEDGQVEIAEFQVGAAMKNAIKNSQHTVRSAYHRATMSPRRKNLYAQVLLACALAPCDEFGYFAAADVRAPLSAIMNKDYEIAAFARHLKTFCGEAKGAILQEIGDKYHRRYRFRNPLMQPYIIIRGIADGVINLSLVEQCASQFPAIGESEEW